MNPMNTWRVPTAPDHPKRPAGRRPAKDPSVAFPWGDSP